MTLGRVAHTLAALTLLGSICADVVSSRCDLPRAGRSQAAIGVAARHDSDADPCSSGCMPDCYSCSRSEEAAVIRFESQPQVVVATVSVSDARASEGVLSLPYHPPLQLLY